MFFSIKNKTNFTASSLHSKQKGGECPSVYSPPLSIYVVCLKALVRAGDKHGFGNLLTGSLRRGLGWQDLRGTILRVDSVDPTYILSSCQPNCYIKSLSSGTDPVSVKSLTFDQLKCIWKVKLTPYWHSWFPDTLQQTTADWRFTYLSQLLWNIYTLILHLRHAVCSIQIKNV